MTKAHRTRKRRDKRTPRPDHDDQSQAARIAQAAIKDKDMTPAEHAKVIERAVEIYSRDFAIYCDTQALTDFRVCSVSLATLQAAIQAGVGAAANAAAPAHGKCEYISPVCTVADLANNLMLLDQALPIRGAQYIEHDGRRRAITIPPTVSLERVKDDRWIGAGDVLNTAIIWTRAEQPAQAVPAPGVEAVSEREFKQFLSDVLTAAGLVTHGKQCKALGRRLGEMSMRLLTAPKTAAAPAKAGEREAFEAWWPTVGQTIGMVAAWKAWQASAARAGAHDPVGVLADANRWRAWTAAIGEASASDSDTAFMVAIDEASRGVVAPVTAEQFTAFVDAAIAKQNEVKRC